MRSLGGNPTQAQLQSIIAEENLTAPFDFPRFLEQRDAFKVLDKENTGFVAVADLRHILTSIGGQVNLCVFVGLGRSIVWCSMNLDDRFVFFPFLFSPCVFIYD